MLTWAHWLPPLLNPKHHVTSLPSLFGRQLIQRTRAACAAGLYHKTVTRSISRAQLSSTVRYNHKRDTIFALSSGAGVKAGVSVIRISGPESEEFLKLLTRGKKPPTPRVASLRRLYAPHSTEILDHAITIYFPQPKSFTGEDVAELHVHGSRAVVAGVLRTLSELGGRAAERGEFTRRAFENGRMDLTEVEGLADLIAAETSEQRRQALSQMGGKLKVLYEGWREKLKGCLARAEACIDFGEEVDISEFNQVIPTVVQLQNQMKHHLEDRRRGEIIRDGVKLAIVGPPNAGKSTLFNLLAKRDAAIVSPIAGTTRDVLELHFDWNGIPVTVSDTAGLRYTTEDVIEKEGMERARGAASKADLILFLQDAKSVVKAKEQNECIQTQYGVEGNNIIKVINKIDLAEANDIPNRDLYRTSFLKGDGVDQLLTEMEHRLQALVNSNETPDPYTDQKRFDEIPVITRERHRSHVVTAMSALEAFVEGRSRENPVHLLPLDLATEELRVATREIGAITGTVHVEEVLDVIFQEFCIGK